MNELQNEINQINVSPNYESSAKSKLFLIILLCATVALIGISVYLVISSTGEDPVSVESTSVSGPDNNCCSGPNCPEFSGDWVAGYLACVSGECAKCSSGTGVESCNSNNICEAGENHNNCGSDCDEAGYSQLIEGASCDPLSSGGVNNVYDQCDQNASLNCGQCPAGASQPGFCGLTITDRENPPTELVNTYCGISSSVCNNDGQCDGDETSAECPNECVAGSENIKGEVEALSCNGTNCVVDGWACNSADPSETIRVQVFQDSISNANLVTAFDATRAGDSVIAAECGGSSDHAFRFTIPARFKDEGPFDFIFRGNYGIAQDDGSTLLARKILDETTDTYECDSDTCTDTASATTYNCSTNFQCVSVSDGSGTYSSLSDCSTNCVDTTTSPTSNTYSCTTDYQCVEVVGSSGAYSTLANCSAECVQPLITTSFICSSDFQCIEVQGTVGNYSSSDSCQTNCVATNSEVVTQVITETVTVPAGSNVPAGTTVVTSPIPDTAITDKEFIYPFVGVMVILFGLSLYVKVGKKGK